MSERDVYLIRSGSTGHVIYENAYTSDEAEAVAEELTDDSCRFAVFVFSRNVAIRRQKPIVEIED